jgi:hypothetical protein
LVWPVTRGISQDSDFLIYVKIALTRPSILNKEKGRGWKLMITVSRHWLEYDSVAFLVLLIGIALVEFIVWSM